MFNYQNIFTIQHEGKVAVNRNKSYLLLYLHLLHLLLIPLLLISLNTSLLQFFFRLEYVDFYIIPSSTCIFNLTDPIQMSTYTFLQHFYTYLYFC